MFEDTRNINAACKLIFYEVVGYYTKPDGICHLTNEQFSELFEVSLSTVKRAIQKLCDEGYLVRETYYKDSKTGRARILHLGHRYPNLGHPDPRARSYVDQYKNSNKNNKNIGPKNKNQGTLDFKEDQDKKLNFEEDRNKLSLAIEDFVNDRNHSAT
jgi:DNA-binding transcriptional MocR family regulator